MTRRRSIATTLCVVLVAIVVSTSSAVPAFARPGAPTGCGSAVRRVSAAERGLPVLFVHGFAGAPSDFRRTLGEDRSSMVEAVSRLDGVAAYTFDYATHSLEWVTDPRIGRALGRAIVCLARDQGAPVTVVAHSMGGLATREAQGGVVDGESVARSLAEVITVGTPFHGAQLLSFADGPVGDLLSRVIRTALRACGTTVSGRPGRTLCDLLGATETAAVQGMIPGSEQLSALPPWAEGLRIAAMTAEVEAGIEGPFGFSEQLSVGDFAVSVDSALADASYGSRTFVAGCRTSLVELVHAIDHSPCSHANELANRRIIREVRTRVARAVERARRISQAS